MNRKKIAHCWTNIHFSKGVPLFREIINISIVSSGNATSLVAFSMILSLGLSLSLSRSLSLNPSRSLSLG